MWIAIAMGCVVVGLGAWLAAAVVPVRRLARHLRGDESGIAIGPGDLIRWNEIQEIRVETTAAGPWGDDFFLVIVADGRRPVRIPDPLVPIVLAPIQKLLGFDNDAFIRATASAEKAVFQCWRRREPIPS